MHSAHLGLGCHGLGVPYVELPLALLGESGREQIARLSEEDDPHKRCNDWQRALNECCSSVYCFVGRSQIGTIHEFVTFWVKT